jgi:hypothetical protein
MSDLAIYIPLIASALGFAITLAVFFSWEASSKRSEHGNVPWGMDKQRCWTVEKTWGSDAQRGATVRKGPHDFHETPISEWNGEK